MAADISSCEEYKDRGTDSKPKLRRQIEILSERQEIRTSAPSTGKEDEVNCKDIFANHLIVKNEEFDFDSKNTLISTRERVKCSTNSVNDLINNTSDETEAVQLSEKRNHILSEAVMNLRRWATNSNTLHEAWKRVNIDCRETSQESGVPLKILGIICDSVNDNVKFYIKRFEKFNILVKVTKRVILSASGMRFDPIGVMNPFTIRMKLLLQRMWELVI
ncbi:DUF1758 domain-containing protein [Trichonephila clavipes]|nr:DUF1758 domain-containing protein [Trichonephila clavipes]